MKPEFWKHIKGFKGYYEASSFGRIRSIDRVIPRKFQKHFPIKGKVLVQCLNPSGYMYVGLNKNSITKKLSVHRIIAKTFIPNKKKVREVNHKDGDKLNNHYSNLEWCTPSENSKHAHKNGLASGIKGSANKFSKLKEENIITIRKMKMDGESTLSIAQHFSVDRNTINSILKGKSWKHVPI